MNFGVILFLATGSLGFLLLCAGAYVLLGAGWCLLAGAFSLFCVAGFVRKGLTSG